MADLIARREALAQLERQVEEARRSYRIDELHQAIAEAKTAIEDTQNKVKAIEHELAALIAGRNKPEQQRTRKVTIVELPSPESATTQGSSPPSGTAPEAHADTPLHRHGHVTGIIESPLDDDGLSAEPVAGDHPHEHSTSDQAQESEQHEGIPDTQNAHSRSTRLSYRKSGTAIDAPEHDKPLLEQLRDKKSSICTDADGDFVDTACHICGVNAPRNALTKFYTNNRLDLFGLRTHYRSVHGVALDEQGVYAICAKTELSMQDVRDILADRVPGNPALADCTGVPANKTLADGERRDSAVSVATTKTDLQDKQRAATEASTALKALSTSHESSRLGASTRAQRSDLPHHTSKRKTHASDENIPPASQRPRLSDSTGALEMSSPTMQTLYCHSEEDGDYLA